MRPESGKLQRALSERLILSEATETVGKLIKLFPNIGQNADRGFIGGLVEVLMDFPRQVSAGVADPRRGVAAETQWLSIAAVVDWCEREAEPLYRAVERERLLAAQFAKREAWERK
jgi:hypothetical protein